MEKKNWLNPVYFYLKVNIEVFMKFDSVYISTKYESKQK